jgi:hypothetical protein
VYSFTSSPWAHLTALAASGAATLLPGYPDFDDLAERNPTKEDR